MIIDSIFFRLVVFDLLVLGLVVFGSVVSDSVDSDSMAFDVVAFVATWRTGARAARRRCLGRTVRAPLKQANMRARGAGSIRV